MRTFTFKGLFLTAVFMLLGCLSIQAAAEDLITQQITINLYEAGTLSDKIESSKKYKITKLKIIGKINGTDLRMIREMAGSNYHGDSTEGELYVLDLSEAKIVAGGDSYFEGYSGQEKYYTSNDDIGDHAFDYCESLTSITLPIGITKIGWGAFRACSSLRSLTLPSGITEIGNLAFKDCSGLTSLTIPTRVTEIGTLAFSGCSGLTSLTLPPGITEIKSEAFSDCSGLTSLTIPAGVTKIGYKAFYDCSGLTSFTIPSSITEIGFYAFEGCRGLTSLTIPTGVTLIGINAF